MVQNVILLYLALTGNDSSLEWLAIDTAYDSEQLNKEKHLNSQIHLITSMQIRILQF